MRQTAEASMMQDGHVLISATVWRPKQPPERIGSDEPLPAEGILWFDLEPRATAQDTLTALGGVCDGLTIEMLEDLKEPDSVPEGRCYPGGEIRLASAFAANYLRAPGNDRSRAPAPIRGVLRFEPVEMVASQDWLITNWHPSQTYRGSQVVACGRPPDHAELCEEVATAWESRELRNAGDLGVLVMRELAYSYAPAHRSIYTALENWELDLYPEMDAVDEAKTKREKRAEEASRETETQLRAAELHDLWSSRALLRDWLNPLNAPGLRMELSRAWLPASDHKLVIDVDDRVDRALGALSNLGESLRGSFHLLQIHHAEVERDRAEAAQRRIETAGAIFLIPTLVVGFYGANTWVPGQQRHWGFWIMVIVLALLTVLGVVLVQRYHAAQVTPQRKGEVYRGLPPDPALNGDGPVISSSGVDLSMMS